MISHDEIAFRAYNISREHKTYEQFLWMLAEIELRLQIGSQPSNERIKNIAESIFQQHPQIQEVHWLVAEKLLLWEKKTQQSR